MGSPMKAQPLSDSRRAHECMAAARDRISFDQRIVDDPPDGFRLAAVDRIELRKHVAAYREDLDPVREQSKMTGPGLELDAFNDAAHFGRPGKRERHTRRLSVETQDAADVAFGDLDRAAIHVEEHAESRAHAVHHATIDPRRADRAEESAGRSLPPGVLISTFDKRTASHFSKRTPAPPGMTKVRSEISTNSKAPNVICSRMRRSLHDRIRESRVGTGHCHPRRGFDVVDSGHEAQAELSPEFLEQPLEQIAVEPRKITALTDGDGASAATLDCGTHLGVERDLLDDGACPVYPLGFDALWTGSP